MLTCWLFCFWGFFCLFVCLHSYRFTAAKMPFLVGHHFSVSSPGEHTFLSPKTDCCTSVWWHYPLGIMSIQVKYCGVFIVGIQTHPPKSACWNNSKYLWQNRCTWEDSGENLSGFNIIRNLVSSDCTQTVFRKCRRSDHLFWTKIEKVFVDKEKKVLIVF